MNNNDLIISGSGTYHPKDSISNEELVTSFNAYVKEYNKTQDEPIECSTAEYIERVSGIKSRYVVDKRGILDPQIMHPILEERSDEALSLQAEMGLKAALKALKQAEKKGTEVDALLVASSNLQRPFPATAIEIQNALGANGFAYDLNVACASATFAIDSAVNLLIANKARTVLVINPEICSAYLNFRARDSHFILGDAATALVLEKGKTFSGNHAFKVQSTKLWTKFSNNVRNNFGFLSRLNPETLFSADKLFYQNGKKVFKEVSLKVCDFLNEHLKAEGLAIANIKRFWLHQANLNMNQFIIKKLAGTSAFNKAPIILDEFANTASCGALIAFDKTQTDLNIGEKGVLSSFGAGYSVGSIILERLS